MPIEYEAKFFINHDEIRLKLQNLGAHLVRQHAKMRRYVFSVNNSSLQQWLRVRDEGMYSTLTLKSYDSFKDDLMASVEEFEVKVSDFDTMIQMLQKLGYDVATYVENYREVWQIENCLFMLDTWPWLDPILEIEGDSKQTVQAYMEKLGLSLQNASFGPTRLLYQKTYKITENDFKQTKLLTFDQKPVWVK